MNEEKNIELIGKYHHPFHFNWFSVFAPVVPYVYDGSLSILEMVQKLLLYINKVNKATNDNHTDIINLAAQIDEFAKLVEDLPELIERIEELIAMLPPLYHVNMTGNFYEEDNTFVCDKTYEEIYKVVEDGYMVCATVNNTEAILFYDSSAARFEGVSGGGEITLLENGDDKWVGFYNRIVTEKGGGNITGWLTIEQAPVNDKDAVNKEYVDAKSKYVVHIEVGEFAPAPVIPRASFTCTESFTDIHSKIENGYNVVFNDGSREYHVTYNTAGMITATFENQYLYRTLQMLSTANYIWDNGIVTIEGQNIIKGVKLYNGAITQPKEIVTKEYVDNAINTNTDLMVVAFSGVDPITSDKSISEINEANTAGKKIIGKYGSAIFELVNCTSNSAQFVQQSFRSARILTVTANSITESSYFNITSDGFGNTNQVFSTLNLEYEITEDKQAVNKEYVDEAIANSGIEIIEYTITDNNNISCVKTASEIIELLNDNKFVLAHTVFEGNETWGYPVINSSGNLRILLKYSAGKNSAIIRHQSDDSITIQRYVYITENGGTVTGELNVNRTPTQPLNAVNKKYVDDTLANSVPTFMDATLIGENRYTLPYPNATLALMLVRNPFIAVRIRMESGYEILYLSNGSPDVCKFSNNDYYGEYRNEVLVITHK